MSEMIIRFLLGVAIALTVVVTIPLMVFNAIQIFKDQRQWKKDWENLK